MTQLILGLYSGSAAAEVVGVIVTVVQIRGAARRVQAYRATGIGHSISAHGYVRPTGSLTISGPPAPDRERLRILEERVTACERSLVETEDRLRTEYETRVRETVEDSEATTRQRIGALVALVLSTAAPRSPLGRYGGPALVGLGILAGLAADVLSASGH